MDQSRNPRLMQGQEQGPQHHHGAQWQVPPHETHVAGYLVMDSDAHIHGGASAGVDAFGSGKFRFRTSEP
jgi:hypothetical protein